MSISSSPFCRFLFSFFFFFNDTATTEIYTLSLHERSSDLLLGPSLSRRVYNHNMRKTNPHLAGGPPQGDRKSTRLNSSHGYISYAVFCLKKKKQNTTRRYSSSSETRSHETYARVVIDTHIQ